MKVCASVRRYLIRHVSRLHFAPSKRLINIKLLSPRIKGVSTLLNTESLKLVHAVDKNRNKPYITIHNAAELTVASVLQLFLIFYITIYRGRTLKEYQWRF